MDEPIPGPWTISRAQIPEFYTDEWYVNDSADIESVAIVNGEANARRVAAAPEILAALEVFLEHHPKLCGEPICEAARAAIAKAKGLTE